jgi:hypothetical protein
MIRDFRKQCRQRRCVSRDCEYIRVGRAPLAGHAVDNTGYASPLAPPHSSSSHTLIIITIVMKSLPPDMRGGGRHDEIMEESPWSGVGWAMYSF